MSAHRILQNASKFSSLFVNRMAGGSRVPQIQPVAYISTSKKKRDTTATVDPTTITAPKTVEDFANPSKKNYQFYGFEPDNPDLDINVRNHMMFFTVTVFLVGGGFIMTYYPDVRMRDWTQREAYIELARREAAGLPAIDPDLLPRDSINLPSEEELGDFEIII